MAERGVDHGGSGGRGRITPDGLVDVAAVVEDFDPYFFFSSRRRHTRFSRDWSSDVCSSDLFSRAARSTTASRPRKSSSRTTAPACRRTSRRSEERRVGKECRSRWGAEQLKKKGADGGGIKQMAN